MWRTWITNIREPMLVKIKFIQTVVRLELHSEQCLINNHPEYNQIRDKNDPFIL